MSRRAATDGPPLPRPAGRPAPPHLRELEAEAIHVLREAAATCRRPVLLYSIGKDSGTLLHLARKAFHPAPLPFPLLHVDTGWKFRAMYAMRDRVAADPTLRLIVHRNPDGTLCGIDPLADPARHTEVMKTEALKQALAAGGFDAAIGGARRDEERSRAKERIFSFRDAAQRWEPRTQRPELWRLYGTGLGPGESLRVFPLSNWTELDVWHYVRQEGIPVVPLYFAAPRPVLRRGGRLIVPDDDRLALRPGEAPEIRLVRFRSLGCYPLTGAVESTAADLDAVVAELEAGRRSERGGRAIDGEGRDSMEARKREGYF
ncbi:sulfate adenylyltransferase subunit CysD [Roseomonas sp. NAR14]|uniref:Sulfate adenylyltransferase subunit 2 n=1 Tax=Roseomonas acroporae TaxID=2937791 RepID=A0A9X2BTT6_9PROT|nr:sulfate adenylyltransferase subunit CysD [Roseomonas acroporae]MCK8784677.1 sulfate adenylyltransferase subunit CysD [Roseomonas acroporae]